MNTPRPPWLHRVTVANIVTTFALGSHAHTLAIRNDSASKRGVTAYGAIGGGAIITDDGMAALKRLGDVRFEEHIPPTGYDARMTLAADTDTAIARLRVQVLRTILGWARDGADKMIELDVRRELTEELVDDAPAIISARELTSINTQLIGRKCGTLRRSSRGPQGIDTTPFYFCHAARCEDATVFTRMIGDTDERVKLIAAAELATTHNGTREGRLSSGHVLYSNVFPAGLIRPL